MDGNLPMKRRRGRRLPPAARGKPRIGLALGGGGAKGLAHVVALEAFDAANIRPAAIAGASIGAIIGSAYAAGHGSGALRAHVLTSFRDRAEVMAKLFRARVGKLADLFSGIGNPVLVDGEMLLKEFWPQPMPDSFEELGIPFSAVATDYYGRTEAVFTSGALRPAIAASMAVPGLVRPVPIGERLHLDGVATNPLPFDRLVTTCDLIVAVDLIGGTDTTDPLKMPTPLDATLGASLIMQIAIMEAKRATANAKVQIIKPDVAAFAVLDFFAVKKILASAEPIRDEITALLAEV